MTQASLAAASPKESVRWQDSWRRLTATLNRSLRIPYGEIVRCHLRWYHATPPPNFEERVDALLGLSCGDGEGEMLEIRRYLGTRDDHIALAQNPYLEIRRLTQLLALGPGDVLYDLGASCGRVIFYVGLVTDATAIGIEIVPCRVTEANRVLRRLGVKNIRFFAGDVLDCDLSDGSVFFIFNSFGEKTMKEVNCRLQKIAEAKKIRVASRGPSNHFFYDQDWLVPSRPVPISPRKDIRYEVRVFESVDPGRSSGPWNPVPEGYEATQTRLTEILGAEETRLGPGVRTGVVYVSPRDFRRLDRAKAIQEASAFSMRHAVLEALELHMGRNESLVEWDGTRIVLHGEAAARIVGGMLETRFTDEGIAVANFFKH